MSWWTRLRNNLSSHHRARQMGQPDAPADLDVAGSRDHGGIANPDASDRHSTTGTTPTETFVGRIAGDDPGSAEPQGSEVRAEADRHQNGGEPSPDTSTGH